MTELQQYIEAKRVIDEQQARLKELKPKATEQALELHYAGQKELDGAKIGYIKAKPVIEYNADEKLDALYHQKGLLESELKAVKSQIKERESDMKDHGLFTVIDKKPASISITL